MRKRDRPTATETDIRVLRSAEDLERLAGLSPAQLLLEATFLCNPVANYLVAELGLLAVEQRAYRHSMQRPGARGRPPDPRLDEAAAMYVSIIRVKDGIRYLGYRGLKPDKWHLQKVAARYFPDDDQAKSMERIKNAARKYRKP